jgi:hypothetical protein
VPGERWFRRSRGSKTGSRNSDQPPALDVALEHAVQLEQQGRLLDAITMLSAANRPTRDARLERKLIELRYRAFMETDWPTERPAWPDKVEDLYPGTIIPEIDAKDLTADRLRSAIDNHGSLLVRKLVPQDSVDLLVGDVDHVFENFYGRPEDRVAPTDAAWFEPFRYEPKWKERKFRHDAGGVLAVDSPHAMFDLIETFAMTGIERVATEYFRERPALLAKKWTLRRVPHDANPSEWHQDGAFMGQNIRSLNVWLALSHCGDDAPGLDVVGRRLDEIVETGTDGAFLQWTVGRAAVERAARGAIVRPIFDPGDVLLFDHMNLHCTAVDPGMTRDRYAVEAWFFAPSTYSAMIDTADGRDPRIPADQIPLVYSTEPLQ